MRSGASGSRKGGRDVDPASAEPLVAPAADQASAGDPRQVPDVPSAARSFTQARRLMRRKVIAFRQEGVPEARVLAFADQMEANGREMIRQAQWARQQIKAIYREG